MEEPLSRRQRQIMDLLIELGEASVADIVERLDDSPAYNTVRTLVNILEERGHIQHRVDGRRYIYRPRQKRRTLARGALRRVVDTFFGGNIEAALAAHLDDPRSELTESQIDELQSLIDQARKRSTNR